MYECTCICFLRKIRFSSVNLKFVYLIFFKPFLKWSVDELKKNTTIIHSWVRLSPPEGWRPIGPDHCCAHLLGWWIHQYMCLKRWPPDMNNRNSGRHDFWAFMQQQCGQCGWLDLILWSREAVPIPRLFTDCSCRGRLWERGSCGRRSWRRRSYQYRSSWWRRVW